MPDMYKLILKNGKGRNTQIVEPIKSSSIFEKQVIRLFHSQDWEIKKTEK